MGFAGMKAKRRRRRLSAWCARSMAAQKHHQRRTAHQNGACGGVGIFTATLSPRYRAAHDMRSVLANTSWGGAAY